MAKPKKSIQEKMQKEQPEFVDAVASLSVDQLNATLAKLAKDAEAVEEAKENDEALEDAHKLVSELAGPYRDGKKAVRMRSRYVISLIKDKGGA